MQTIKPVLVDDGPVLEATGLVHRVKEPNAPGPHPTVVMLHGRYGNEEVMWIFQKTIPVHWLKIAPRAIEADPHGGYSWILQGDDSWPPLSEFDRAVTAVTTFIQSLSTVYNADPDQIYLMGFSQGAAVAYAVAMRHPGIVKAIAGLVGFVPEDCDTPQTLSALQNLPIFMAVGKQDKRIPYERSQKCATTLRNAQADLSYHEYDTGHKLNVQGTKDLTRWWSMRNR